MVKMIQQTWRSGDQYKHRRRCQRSHSTLTPAISDIQNLAQLRADEAQITQEIQQQRQQHEQSVEHWADKRPTISRGIPMTRPIQENRRKLLRA